MVISYYDGKQWGACTGSVLREIPRIFFGLLGIKAEQGKEAALIPSYGANTLILEEAPWSNQRLFSYKGDLYRTSENTLAPRRINGGIAAQQARTFYQWLSHRFRDMARPIPELRAVWLASRIQAQHNPMSPPQLFSLWRTVQENEALRQTPLLLMAYAANPDNLPGVVPKYLFEYKPSKTSPSFQAWSQVSTHLDIDRENRLYFFYDSTPVQTGARKASRRLGLSESYRWMSALVQLKRQHNNFTQSPPEALLELLLVHAHRVPKTKTLTSMMRSPFPFWAWLAFHTSWASPGQRQPWPDMPSQQEDCTDLYRDFLRQVKEIREYQQDNPVHFQTMARAALAWIKSSEKENKVCDEELPMVVLPLLQKMPIPEATRKERINKRLTWQGVISLKRSLDSAKLSATKDFTGSTPAQNPADLSWPTAIGNLRLGGIDVHPLCRPSHLELMGEFLQNCVQKHRDLDGFVEKARRGHSRFFRLADDHREFLLQLSNAGQQTWKVQQLRGRENHDPTPEAEVVGQRVAELYTLLSAESPTLPTPIPSNTTIQDETLSLPWDCEDDGCLFPPDEIFVTWEGEEGTEALARNLRTEDEGDIVEIIRSITIDLDDPRDV